MKILAIDFDSLFRRNWEAEAGQDSGNAFRRTVEEIQRRRDGWDRVVLAADSGASFRKAKATDYKEGRTNPGAAYFDQRKRCLSRLAADACIIVPGPEVEGGHAEADDVLGWLATTYTAHTRAMDVDAAQAWYLRIISGDGDLEQLVSDPDGIDLLKLTEREPWKAADVLGARGVSPDKVPHLKALCGDKSDNYPGFEGIGPKTAALLINKYGDAVSAATSGSDDQTIRMTVPQRAALKSGGAELAGKGLYLATLRTDLPLDFAALILPEPKQTSIASDEPMGGEPVPPPRPTPPAQEPQPGRAHAPAPAALAVVETSPQSLTGRPVAAMQRTAFDPMALQPQDLDSAWRVTKAIFDARVYPQFPNRESILVAILDAHERGVPVGAALRNAYVVKGKLGWSAGYLAGLVLASGKADYFELIPEACDASSASVRFKRRGRPEGRHTFTIEDAKRAGYMSSGMWEKEPRAMLRAAAVRTAARAYFPDVVSGMYMPDEIRGAPVGDDIGAADV